MTDHLLKTNMDRIENTFVNLNLRNSACDSTNCSHETLTRVPSHSTLYQCEQCHLRSQVTFDCETISSNATESSRLLNEFEDLNEFLGRGGYGFVAKFRNKKDDRIYAIKKTEATEMNEREVKVLSTLQHENIVRYYTCWTEPNDSAFPKMRQPDAKSLDTAGEKWFQENVCDQTDFDDDESMTNSNQFSISLPSNYTPPEEVKKEESSKPAIIKEESPNIKDVLYIQMEFCEKRTLREAIKSEDLIHNRLRMWRLFRQLVEGISYFHSKGVIHRDLKPENVFLSSDDCVKIGDFGLARSRPQLNNTSLGLEPSYLTTDRGTSLYMAPELSNGLYDTKVDMYSLGIIFFEMCHEPFVTETERREQLSKLRESDFILPLNSALSMQEEAYNQDYFTGRMPPEWKQPPKITNNMIKIINQLLVHDPIKRPSADELLQSSIMPPALLDNAPQFFQFLDFVLFSQTSYISKAYEYNEVMRRCLNQSTSEWHIFKWLYIENYEWFYRKATFNIPQLTAIIHEIFIKRCQEMGAKYCQTNASIFPKLTINSDYKCKELKKLANIFNRLQHHSREFIDVYGTPAILPGDSHTPFAHTVAAFDIDDFKRYCVNQVYTSYSIGPPPEATTELVFDIVSPSSTKGKNLRKSDVEVIKVISNVLKDCKQRSFVLQISHHLLIEAVFIYCKVPDDQKSKVCRQLEQKLENIRDKADGYLAEDDQLQRVWKILNFIGSLSAVKPHLNSLPDWIGSDAGLLADKAFEELEEIINLAQFVSRGQKNSIKISVNLVVGLENYETHSGFLFEFIYPPKIDEFGVLRKSTVLASGGRYDSLVATFHEVIDNRPDKTNCDFRPESRGQHITGGVIYVNNLLSVNKCQSLFELPAKSAHKVH